MAVRKVVKSPRALTDNPEILLISVNLKLL